MLKVLLTMENHVVKMVFDGKTAIAEAFEFKPEIILLDIGLPDIDGYEVAKEIRAKLPETLLIALTGWGQEADRQLSKKAGFNFHLVKPVELDQLLELIHDAE